MHSTISSPSPIQTILSVSDLHRIHRLRGSRTHVSWTLTAGRELHPAPKESWAIWDMILVYSFIIA
ncbi:MAG: hypothetical protein BSOLF_1157 [Candidatus Carbobacillus altaicus]|uniref:Uncharacterized protein n=1 Tax=Candidatus Carbonibacillus altaicus TaxID=2163959 RepID=A0A2R6Y4P0_9BACL|nr:MAG: hypothetical protein BSOLF_1157 [Candidatus Carbobacillus altaicus]